MPTRGRSKSRRRYETNQATASATAFNGCLLVLNGGEQPASDPDDDSIDICAVAAHWMTVVIKARAHVLREVDGEMRHEIIAALGTIGPPATTAIPELCRLGRDDVQTARCRKKPFGALRGR